MYFLPASVGSNVTADVVEGYLPSPPSVKVKRLLREVKASRALSACWNPAWRVSGRSGTSLSGVVCSGTRICAPEEPSWHGAAIGVSSRTARLSGLSAVPAGS